MSRLNLPFSVFGMPLLAIGGLLVSLWHPQADLRVPTSSATETMLLNPNPRLDKSLTIFLRQEARNVASCRRKNSTAALTQTIDEYNLTARECTPAVFQETHLPSWMPS